MAIKAKKLGSKKGFEKSLKGGNSKYALRVPPEGATVRFLTEPEEWFEVEQHFDKPRQTSYPCIGMDGGCIACEEGMESKPRWYANVYSIDEDRVTVFEMPKSVAKMLYKKYDRYNTIMDRNYEVTKEGTGLNTEYDVDALSPEHLPGQSKMGLIDIMDFLERLHDDAMQQIAGGEEEVSASGRRPTRNTAASRRSKPRRRADLDDEDDFDDDEDDDNDRPVKRKRPPSVPRKSAPSKSMSKTPVKRRARR